MEQKAQNASRKTKYLFIVFLIFLFIELAPHAANAQSNTIEAHYKYGSAKLSRFIGSKFHQISKDYDIGICQTSAFFVRFNVDMNGNIDSLSFSANKNIPDVFRNIVKAVILSTNGSWEPKRINGHAVESKPFLLPVIYAMEAGCSTQKLQLNNSADDLAGIIVNMLNFENNTGSNTTQLDCIILEPLHVFSQN